MSESPLTVDASSGTGYDSIQRAVDDADGGDTVEVRPGRYPEQVHVDASVTLEAAGEVVLDGEGLGEPTDGSVLGVDVGDDTRGMTIEPGVDVAPEIVGFTIRGYEVGLEADGTTGGWTARDLTLELNGDDGISALEAEGDWTVEDSVVRLNVEEGIDAERTTGSWTMTNTIVERNGDDGIDADSARTTSDWQIRRSAVRYNGDHGLELKESAGDWVVTRSRITGNASGIGAQRTAGDWSVRRSDLGGNRFVGVNCIGASGDWLVERTHVTGVSTGIWSPGATGDWKITDSVVGDTYRVPNDNLGEGTAVFVPETRGEWEITGCLVRNVEGYAIDASGADHEGDATGNRWGGRSEEADLVSVGNVNCDDPRATGPGVEAELSEIGPSVESDPPGAVAPGFDGPSPAVRLSDAAHLLVGRTDVFE